ncbi:hypothetical protein P4O66_006921, partial [Electrophorus voltai]
MHSSNHIIKFADDTTVVGLINKDNRMWSNNPHEWLQVDFEVVKRITGILMQGARTVLTHMMVTEFTISISHDGNIWSAVTEQGTQLEKVAENLTWTLNTSSIIKRAQQHLYFLRKLREAHLPSPILTTFYRGTVESILSSCIITWFGNCTAFDRKTLQRIVRTAEKIIGVSLPCITNTYITRCIRKATNIVKDPTHPSHELFTLLPSGR